MSESPIRVGIGGEEPVPGGENASTYAPPEPERIDLLAPPTPEELHGGTTPAQALEAALSAPAQTLDTVTIRVPSRRGVALEFDPSRIDSTKRKAWQKRVTKRSRRLGGEAEVDDFLFACLVLANTHISTSINGREATDAEGTPYTFAHAELWRMVGARDPQECIQKLFANDQHVTVASGEVLLASGIDDDLATSDPTAG